MVGAPSASVAWAVAVALHVAFGTLVARGRWILPVPPTAFGPRHAEPSRERVVFFALPRTAEPTARNADAPSAQRRAARDLKDTAASAPVASSAELIPSPAPALTTVPEAHGERLGERTFRSSLLTPTVLLAPERGVRSGPRVAEDKIRTMLSAAAVAVADSMRRALEQQRAVADWTWGQRDGARVGVSPGRLHLGSLELPLPIGLISLRDVEPQARARRQMSADLREQAARLERDSIRAEAIDALRRRRARGVVPPR